MSKRNLILLIIILIILSAGVLGFFYFYQPISKTGESAGTNFFANFFPFGKSNIETQKDTTPPADISDFKPTDTEETVISKLTKISSFPVAGFTVFMKERLKDIPVVVPPIEPIQEEVVPVKTTKKKTTKPTPPPTEFIPALRYVNSATGNIYQTFVDKLDERKFSTTIIPKVYEAYFGDSGGSVIMRYLKEDLPAGQAGNKTIETFVGVLAKEYLGADGIGTNEVNGIFLPENITDVSISPDTSKIFYLFNVGDTAVGVTASATGNTKVQVFDSPFIEWLSSWPVNKMITITTKPSANVPGYMYAINPERKDLNKILGSINGLTTLTSPDGKLVLYADDNLSLRVLNINDGEKNLFGIRTLPEKCVWGKESEIIYCSVPKFITGALYPDSWYQGEISFSDEIWKIDAKNGNETLIADPISIESGEDVDGIKLNLDENENYLFFVNKKDSYLWKLDLR